MDKNKFIWIIVALLLIAIGYGGYVIGTQKNKTSKIVTPIPSPSRLSPVTPSVVASPSSQAIPPSSQNVSSVPEMTPVEAAQRFYASFEDCMKNPPPPAAGQVSLYCQSHNPFITATFVTNLERGGVAKEGADPVVCAQNFPEKISVGTMTVVGNTTAKGKVTEAFGPSTVQPSVSLLKETTGWKVDNITCPRP
jgi:hypothetical protein